MHTYYIHGAKGGSFATTFAATLALLATQQNLNTAICTLEPDDMLNVLGVGRPANGFRITDNLAMPAFAYWRDVKEQIESWPDDEFDVVVVDAGTRVMERHEDATNVLLMRGCFLAACRVVRESANYLPFLDEWIFISEHGRALTSHDLVRATGFGDPLSTINVDSAAARVVDAGLMMSRLPAAHMPAAEMLLAKHARVLKPANQEV